MNIVYLLVVEWVPKIWFSGITGISHKNGLNWRQVEQGQIFACDDFPNFRSAFSSILHFKKSIKCGKNEENPYGTCIQYIQFRVLHIPPLFSTYLPSKKEPAGFFSIVLMWGKSNCDIFYKKTPLLFSIILTYYGFDLLILNIIKYYWNFIIWPLINFYYWIKVYYCLPCLWKTLKKFHNFTNP